MQPKKIDPVSPLEVQIRWQDGVLSSYGARQLRLACPCAQCIEEWSGKALLVPATVAADIELRGLDLVGRYGLSFQWSDGHRTGIFTFELLRKLAGEVAGA